MGKILYFGYGAYRSRNKVLRILGKEPVGGYGALLDGYQLAIEPLELVPEGLPKQILERIFGKSFRSYTIKKGEGLVAGVIWEFDDHDLKLAEAEFIGTWRELVNIEVMLANKQKVKAITDKIIKSDQLTEIADGLNYVDNLNMEKKGGNGGTGEDDEYKVQEIQRIKAELEKLAGENHSPQVNLKN
jgi:hypothetical protein